MTASISVEFEESSNLRITRVIGKLTFEELMGSLSKTYADKRFDPDADVLWDLSKADLSAFLTQDVRAIRDYVSKNWGKSGKSKAALVVAHDLDYGLSRMYEFFLESRTSNEVQVFRDLDEAFAWIRK